MTDEGRMHWAGYEMAIPTVAKTDRQIALAAAALVSAGQSTSTILGRANDFLRFLEGEV